MKLAVKILAFALAAVAAVAAPREKLQPGDQTLGNPKAPVVVVEYLAPTCPHCSRFAATVFPRIKKAYIDTGKVLYVVRVFPLSAADGAVSGLAKCQKPGRYYDFLDLALRKQAMWDPVSYDIPDVEAALIRLAGMAGMKPDQAKLCMGDAKEFDRLNTLAEDATARLQIRSVPSIVIGGKVYTGEDEATWPVLHAKIEALLPKPPAATPAARPAPAKPAPAKKK